MKFVIRADASRYIGSGHIMRCLVFARGLRDCGHEVIFACLPQTGDMIDFVTQQGFQVKNLTRVDDTVKPTHEADYLGWLRRTVEEDAQDFLSHIKEADWVITDHYAIDKQWQQIVKNTLSCRIFAIDDLCREHEADILLDQTLGRLSTDYSGVRRVLAGCHYALLKPEFSILREKALDRKLLKDKTKVLVSMGGVDAPNATLKITEALSALKNIDVTVLLSPRAPHYQIVSQFCAKYSHIKHIDFVENMAELMLEQDIAIGAPGSTSWERCCLGLPSIIIPIAENQQEIARQLSLHNASALLNIGDIAVELKSKLEYLICNFQKISKANLSLCDGLGLYRILQNINSDAINLQLVPAVEQDIELIYKWQCHPNTRKYSLTPDIPTWEEHVNWMKAKLASSDYFYLIKDIAEPTCPRGAVRLDRLSNNCYVISIFIEPDSYGQGIASQALSLIDSIHPHIEIHATVLVNNLASQKLFERSSFTRMSQEQFIRFPIRDIRK